MGFKWVAPGTHPLATWYRCGGPGRVVQHPDTETSRPDPSGTTCGCPSPPCQTGWAGDRGPGTVCPHSCPSVRLEVWTKSNPHKNVFSLQQNWNLNRIICCVSVTVHLTCSWRRCCWTAGPRSAAWPCFPRSRGRWWRRRGTRAACARRRSPG